MQAKIVAGSLFVHCKIAYFNSVTTEQWLPVSLWNFMTIRKTHLTISQGFFRHRQLVIVDKISLCPNSMMQTVQNVLDKKCLIFPYHFKIDSETALQYNSIGPFISHSVIYILGGPMASFIPQVYNYVRKYVFLVQHHMYSLAVNTSFDLQSPWAAVQ